MLRYISPGRTRTQSQKIPFQNPPVVYPRHPRGLLGSSGRITFRSNPSSFIAGHEQLYTMGRSPIDEKRNPLWYATLVALPLTPARALAHRR